MKGQVRDPRTRTMMEMALLHARAAFETSCASKAPEACEVYEGSVWNEGKHVTVIVDRKRCVEHDDGRPAMARVEAWLYDVTGDSVVYLGRQDESKNRGVPAEPGDVPASVPAQPFLKS